jgi:hypothetical protein
MSFTPIALGNGRFCYSGPNCRKHSVRTSVSYSSPQEEFNSKLDALNFTATESRLAEDLEESFDDNLDSFRNFVCTESTSLSSLEELGENSFSKGMGATWCEEHNAYHVFDLNVMNRKIVQLRGDDHRLVTDALLDQETSDIYRNKIQDFYTKNLASVLQDGKKTLSDFRGSISGTDLARVAEKARHEERMAAKGIPFDQTSTPKQTKPDDQKRQMFLDKRKHQIEAKKKRVLVPPEKVDKKLLLEYYVCSRKQKHASTEAAHNAMIRNHNKELALFSAYPCEYCGQVHIGHTPKAQNTHATLMHAKKHWAENPDKSNIFAFAKGLI